MAALSTLGFHHITMVSSDARRTLHFYRAILGLGLVKRTVNFDDPKSYHLYFGDEKGSPGTLLTFFEWPGQPRGRPGIGGVHHLAMGVADEAGLLKWKRRLTDLGIPVTGPKNRGYFMSLYFTDPDGQILEIATAGPGYAIDEPADGLGQSVVYPAPSQLSGSVESAEFESRTHPEPVAAITPDMRLSGIHHISGITGDLGLAHEFYTDTLGLSRVKQSVNQDDGRIPHHFWANYDGHSVRPQSALTLFGWPPSYHYAVGGVGQTHHIAFRATDVDEQRAWREKLLTQGVSVSPVMDRTYFQSIYFHAPDGLLLEIATDGPGFAVDEPVAHLGEQLALPAWLEPDREKIEKALVAL